MAEQLPPNGSNGNLSDGTEGPRIKCGICLEQFTRNYRPPIRFRFKALLYVKSNPKMAKNYADN
jgi:hypothetical protein